jgi:hypothetical protein
MIICCFKWRRQGRYVLPHVCDYTAAHVNALYRGVKRHLPGLTEFVCVTDDATGIDPAVRTVPLWSDHLSLGGAYVRLGIYDPEKAALIGPRFMVIDLDSAIVGDLTPLVSRPEPLVLNRYTLGNVRRQYYNTALQLMDAGCKPNVWRQFRPRHTEWIESDPELVGTEQAWIASRLGPRLPTFGPEHGVYDVRDVGDTPPADARIVFFHGAADPSADTRQWATENWG